MDSIRFDGRVAIVTGAGRGIGKAYAQLLAELGASVVVNDLGGTRSGDTSDPEIAEAAVTEIRAAGGVAMSDGSDVASVAEVEKLVERTIDTFGRVDIVVNNAGMYTPDAFPDLDASEFHRYFDVHVGGSFNLTRACWPHMARAGYGRVVMTTSHGVLGAPFLTSYGTAKGGVLALGRGLATIGRDIGIKVNTVAPEASTRLAPGRAGEDTPPEQRSPALVSPLVALLCHESCPVNGETFLSGGRRYARLVIAEAEGYLHPDYDVTPETISRNWAKIMDVSDLHMPTDTLAWVEANHAKILESPAVVKVEGLARLLD
jgi:NAD(P)-dependent dehydrogenase (short-subunit alcohol dehydrogenase family)